MTLIFQVVFLDGQSMSVQTSNGSGIVENGNLFQIGTHAFPREVVRFMNLIGSVADDETEEEPAKKPPKKRAARNTKANAKK